MATSESSIIQELIPQLAAALGQVRRVPGKGDAWIANVIAALERDSDPRHERMRRRIGFAQRLGEMAGLTNEEISLATLGLFFHELLPVKRNSTRVSRPWREYFMRHEGWLRPALEICEAIRSKDWPEIEGAAGIVGKVAAVYDTQTLDRHERPLQVVESIVEAVEGRDAQRIVDLLWTEDGQELCDHHFRRHPRGYKLDSGEIRHGVALLYRSRPRISSDVDVQSVRFSGSRGMATTDEEEEQPVAATQNPPAGANNFDRRREALRSRGGEQDSPADAPGQYVEHQPDELDPRPMQPRRPDAEPTPIERVLQQQEGRMNQLTGIPAAGHGRRDALDLVERLQELRIQLGQIQQIAAHAEQLLAGVAPQIDEFATRIADVEGVMERWRGRSAA